LTDYLCERLRSKNYDIVSSRAPGEKSQIVCIRHPAGFSAMALYHHLNQRKIITAPRGDRLRIARIFITLQLKWTSLSKPCHERASDYRSIVQ